MFCRSNNQSKFVLVLKSVRPRSQIRFVPLSFMSGLQLHQDQPISNKKKKKRTNRDFLMKAKVMWKPFIYLKDNIDSQLPKTDLTPKDNWFALKLIHVWSRFINSNPRSRFVNHNRNRKLIGYQKEREKKRQNRLMLRAIFLIFLNIWYLSRARLMYCFHSINLYPIYLCDPCSPITRKLNLYLLNSNLSNSL
jgi:hypothetical protein